MVQDRAILTVADQYGLSNGAIFNDLEQQLIAISRSHHFWRWISQKRLKIPS